MAKTFTPHQRRTLIEVCNRAVVVGHGAAAPQRAWVRFGAPGTMGHLVDHGYVTRVYVTGPRGGQTPEYQVTELGWKMYGRLTLTASKTAPVAEVQVCAGSLPRGTWLLSSSGMRYRVEDIRTRDGKVVSYKLRLQTGQDQYTGQAVMGHTIRTVKPSEIGQGRALRVE